MRRSKLPALRPAKGPKKAEKRAVPKAEMDMDVDKTVSLSTLRSTDGREAIIKPSKAFTECPPKEQQNLFLQKCKECCKICDFSSPLIEQKAKQTKAALLKHLASSFTIPHLVRSISADHIKEFYYMLSINLFRPFPQLPVLSPIEFHDSLYDSSWPHLSLVYDAMLASFNCPQTPGCITSSFIYKFIGNGASPDDREKIVVRDILHTLYTKFMNIRETVRNNIAFQFSNGICSAELIEFFVSVVSGFNSPLKQDHVDFYYRFLLPLHTNQKFVSIQKPLVQCVIRFIQKSAILFPPTIAYIIKHWPCSDRKKQIDLLNELGNLIANFEINVTPKIAASVFKLVGNSVLSENPDVSEAAIDILMNPDLAAVLKANAQTVFPLIVEPVYRAAKNHWDECTKSNAYIALQVLSEIDGQTFNRANEAHKLIKAQRSAAYGVFKNNWTRIFDLAKQNDKTIISANIEGLRDKGMSH